MSKVIYLFIALSLSFSQYYDIGETMITSHQNQSHSVCYGQTDAGSSSSLKFADYNGATNGGDYHVIWLELSASW